MIIGFPYQDKQTIMEEFRMITGLGPSLLQILIYFAFPGTPLYQRMLEEGYYLAEYRKNPDYRTFDGFSMHFSHPHFSAAELEDLQTELYRQNYEILGPSVLRVIRVWFEGYRTLKHSSNPLLNQRGESMREYVRNAIPAIYPALFFGPNRARRADARALLREIKRNMGGLSLKEQLLCFATIPLSLWTWVMGALNIAQQPKLLRVEYHGPSIPDNGRHMSEQNKPYSIASVNSRNAGLVCARSGESKNGT
jgi:hypothetical protein